MSTSDTQERIVGGGDAACSERSTPANEVPLQLVTSLGSRPPFESDEKMDETALNETNGNDKRPSEEDIELSASGGGLSEKKLRRLEKNRLSARECRRRKREAAESLERQINILEGENLRLRLQLQIGEEAEDSASREQSKLTSEIDDLLKSGASEVEIFATLEEFKEKYADYGKSRRSAIEFHLRNLERLLMPTQVTSVVMTAMQGGGHAVTKNAVDSVEGTSGTISPSDATPCHQDNASDIASVEMITQADEGALKPAALQPTSIATHVETTDVETFPPVFLPVSPSTITSAEESTNSFLAGSVSSSSGDSASVLTSRAAGPSLPWTSAQQQLPNLERPKSLFQYLVRYLDVTPQQATALKDSRFVAQELDGCLESALNVLQELRGRLATTTDNLDSEFNHVRSILTPTQAAKFLVWVANNKACMHMLNELWDRVYAVAPDSPSDDRSSAAPPPPFAAERQLSTGDDDD
jgi:hypothetical protein